MKICLKVKGDQLLTRVAAEIARADSAFPRQYAPNVPLHWEVEAMTDKLALSALKSAGTHPALVLIEAMDARVIDELWSLSSRDYHAMARRHRDPEQLMPVILVLEHELPTTRLLAVPAIVSDWVNGMDAMHDLARRAIAALKRQSRLGFGLDHARLSLQVESRLLCHGSDAILLTPSEVAVAELFLAHFGSVIPLDELQLLFKLAGRSIEGSNLRVTMFQLRFKIEALTRCRYTLTSAYGLGYVLRHGKAGEAGIGASEQVARQSAA